MIRILHVLSQLGRGGVETQLFNLYKEMDREKVHFDFIVHGDYTGELESYVKQEGSKIYHVTPKKESFYKNFKEIDSIIKKGNYDEVFAHQNFSSFIALFSALRHKVRVRVAYARGAINNEKALKKIQNVFLRLLVKLFSNYRWAIAPEAGKWVYGKRWKEGKRDVLFKNSVDTDRFIFNAKVRDELRKKLCIENSFAVLMIGRFSPEKNHMFALDVIEGLLRRRRNAILLFMGIGGEEERIRTEVNARGLNEKVIFYGTTHEPERLMNASDVLIFPSKHEGFGNVAIEAQCCGLPVIASDRIPIMTKATDIISYLSIDYGVDEWVDKILSINTDSRTSKVDDIKENGFALKSQAIKMENLMYGYYNKTGK